MKKQLYLIVFWLAFTFTGYSQTITRYQFTASSGSFTEISGPSTASMTGGKDDGAWNNIPIGFDFWYMGQRYTAVSASTNGWLTFGTSIINYAYENSLSSGGTRPLIAPLWDDLEAHQNAEYKTTGTEGKRVFTFQYIDAEWRTSAWFPAISFQVKLYESTGAIEFVYRREWGASNLSGPSASIGITGTGTGTGSFLSLNNTGTLPVVSNTVETKDLDSKPVDGQTYSFKSPVPVAPALLNFSGTTSSAMTLNWKDNSNNEVGFVIYRSTNNVNFEFVSQTAANVTSSVQSALEESTRYYWKVYAVTEGALSTPLAGNNITNCAVAPILQMPANTLQSYFRMNNNALDETKANNGTAINAPSPMADRFDVVNSAYSFNGSNQYVITSTRYTNPKDFTVSIWFKTNTTTGGKLIGFGNTATNLSAQYDRHIYMNNAGQIIFGAYSGVVNTISTIQSFNDNQWHLATATLSSTSGMKLYVDGIVVGSHANKVAENYAGYWRIGGDNLSGWTAQPSSSYFRGMLDDAAIFNRALTEAEVQTVFLSADGAANNGQVCAGEMLSLTATNLSGASYSWLGPNGFVSTSRVANLSYSLAAEGVYSVTVTAMAGCVATAYTRVVSSTKSGEWTGNVSSDWNNPTNWCNGVLPTQTTDVTISQSAVRMPVISANAFCNNLIIANGATVTTQSAGILNVSGLITNNGYMVNNGATVFKGTEGEQTFINVAKFNNVRIENTAGLNIPVATEMNDIELTTGQLKINSYMLTVKGNWSNNSAATALVAGSGTVKFSGTGTQMVGGSFETTFNNVTVDSSGGMVTLANNILLTGSLRVYGNLDLQTFAADRIAVGGTLYVHSTGYLKIGGVQTMPSRYSTYTLQPASRVEYGGTNQSIANQVYGNLILSASTGAAVKTAAGSLNVQGSFSLIKNGGTSVTFNPVANVVVIGDINIGSGTILNGKAFTYTASGNWINNGTFTGNTGTVILAGVSKNVAGTGVQGFNHLTVAANGITFSNQNLSLSGNLTTTGSGSFTQDAGGTTTMTGNGAIISGQGISIENLTISGTGKVNANTAIILTGNLRTNASTNSFTAIDVVNMNGNVKTVSGAGSFTFKTLNIKGSITATSGFTINGSLNVSGSFTATAGTTTFSGNTSLSGMANLYNVAITGTRLQLTANTVMGVAGGLTLSTAALDVTTSVPNTMVFNGSSAQNVNAITYHHLKLTNGNNKTATGGFTTNGDFTIGINTSFTGGAFTHSFYGDWINKGNFIAGISTIRFAGAATSVIYGETNFNVLAVDHDATSTAIELNSNVYAKTVNMIKGTLLTHNKAIEITSDRTGPGIILGNIKRTHAFTTGVAYAFEGPDNTITFAAASGISSVTVKVVKGNVTDFPAGASINRWYDITVPTGTYEAVLRLHYEDAELNGNTEASLNMWKYQSSAWLPDVDETGRSDVRNYIEVGGLNNITNRWTLSGAITELSWGGSTSSEWSNPANWLSDTLPAMRVPGAGDIVNLGDKLFVNQPNISTAVSVKNIVFGSAKNVTLNLSTGGSLVSADIGGNWTANASHIIKVNDQSVNIQGELELSKGFEDRSINVDITDGSLSVTGSLIQSGNASIKFEGAGTLKIGGVYKYTSGDFVAGSGSVEYDGVLNQEVVPVAYYDLLINKAGGIASLENPVTVNNNLSIEKGSLTINKELFVKSSVNIRAGTKLINQNILHVGGDWNNAGEFIGNGLNTIFDGAGTQKISKSTFNNLEFRKPATSRAELTGDVLLKGNLLGTSGIVDIKSFFFNRDVEGGTATLLDDATLIIDADNAPNNFTTHILTSNSTLIFSGSTEQHLFFPGLVCGNLVLRNTGIKTLLSSIVVKGKLKIENDATLDAQNSTIELDNDWINEGNFEAGSGAVIFTGSNNVISGATTFYDVTTTGKYEVLSDLTFEKLLTLTPTGVISSGVGTRHIMNGDLMNRGDLYLLGETVFTGAQKQTLRLQDAVRTVAAVITFNGHVSPVLQSSSEPRFAILNVNNTGGVNASVGWTILSELNVSAGASFNCGPYTQNFYGKLSNLGTITSSGTINFIPVTPVSLNFGTGFTSTGTVNFGGTGAISLFGTPVSFRDVVISNKNVAGVYASSGWNITRNLDISSAATFGAGDYTHRIGGNLTNKGIIIAGGGSFYFNGAIPQFIENSSHFHNIIVDKTAGDLVLSTDIAFAGLLNFKSGIITTNEFVVTQNTGGSIVGASSDKGWINGYLGKFISNTNATTFETGDSVNFAPATLTFNDLSQPGILRVKTIPADHPAVHNSDINALRSVNRYWQLSSDHLTFGSFDATLHFNSSDKDVNTDPSNFQVESYISSSWKIATKQSNTENLITATGISQLGEIAIGEVCNYGTSISFPAAICTNQGYVIPVITGNLTGTFSAGAGLAINVTTGYIDAANSTPGEYLVKYTIGATASCTDFITSVPVRVAVAGSWLGTVDSDWDNAANWACGGVPSQTINVTIGNNVAHFPHLTGTASVNDITVQAQANLVVTGQLAIAGSIFNAGFLDVSKGTVKMSGKFSQSIPANAFHKNGLQHLIIDNSSTAGVDFQGPLDIFGSLTYEGSGRTVNTNGNLTLKSDINTTAWVGDMTGNQIIGDVSVERYVSPKKGWRLLSIPTHTSQTVKQSWQESGTNNNDNPVPGFGTQITGAGGTAAGFDLYSALPSLKTYNPATNTWVGIPNTNLLPVQNNEGYMIYIRGNRKSNAFNSPVTETVLRTKGLLYTGQIGPFTMEADQYHSIGNPYASPVDFTKLTRTPGVDNVLYQWDPFISGYYNAGGFQTISATNNWEPVPGGSSAYPSGVPATTIQSGQAFLVHTTRVNSFAPQNYEVYFNEESKISGEGIVTFARNFGTREQDAKRQFFKASLLTGDTAHVIADGNVVAFDVRFSNEIDNNDARKIAASGENMDVKRNNVLLAVEARQPVNLNDTIYYNLKNLARKNYQLRFMAVEMNTKYLEAVLVDKYLNTQTPLSLSDTNFINITVNADAASSAADRFKVVFRTASVLPVQLVSLNATLENKFITVKWKVENESGMNHYEIERSTDGINFHTVENVIAGNEGKTSYQWLDKELQTGYQYYRIRAVDASGKQTQSRVVKVLVGEKTELQISVYPNPVEGNTIRVQMNDQPAGKYQFRVLSANGQMVVSKQVDHFGNSGVISLDVQGVFAKGIYQLQVTDAAGVIKTIRVYH